jgi:hypothetical protein
VKGQTKLRIAEVLVLCGIALAFVLPLLEREATPKAPHGGGTAEAAADADDERGEIAEGETPAAEERGGGGGTSIAARIRVVLFVVMGIIVIGHFTREALKGRRKRRR